jgi:hypothetical protein
MCDVFFVYNAVVRIGDDVAQFADALRGVT